MEAHFSPITRAPVNIRSHLPPPHRNRLFFPKPPNQSRQTHFRSRRSPNSPNEIRVSNGDSYLDMWKNAVDRERKTQEFQEISDNYPSAAAAGRVEDDDSPDALDRRTEQFKKILEVPKDERDRAQRMQVIDRAAAAIAAARSLLEENPPLEKAATEIDLGSSGPEVPKIKGNAGIIQEGHGTPGPDFWSWSPPLDSSGNSEEINTSQAAQRPSSYPNPVSSLMEKERSPDFLPLPFESNHNPPLPPLQSLIEVEKVDASSSLDLPSSAEERKLDVLFSTHAAAAVDALQKGSETSSHGVNEDGSKWWKETGIEYRPDGVVCKWTLTRGVSADGGIEWEDKYWEAADQFDYKELGSEKSGRDAAGNVWREYWKEVMWQDLRSGLLHIEKTADKWGKTGMDEQWQEKWWEHYDASGQAEKWAHKWCRIDPYTPLEAGHAHVWHERWGEKYDGQGSSMKYTDKWAERLEGDAWTKWGDKWDEDFDINGHGIKQGETWWEGKYGERWNRTWGERHNGSGWLHKYGKSSSGEHWDTYVKQDTWYERYPHYGFELCFKNSVQLREVQKPIEFS
ncbi:protein LIKE EARLY STARVATION, chloroplastic isoform X2 [Magnolia sinica]|uniref:protein LIKE EARLY STARVATION, chloroplastic isoform X2 n=1 Tax=Magnolia sinica TaxID=86752 RepID=UPI00265B643B|nr:protein LIKE EARLY STARVATION, chloroplastic isoform X2 [Magnolia sinica]